jgi:hypothetical protein
VIANWKREREIIAQEFRQVADQLENGGDSSNNGAGSVSADI